MSFLNEINNEAKRVELVFQEAREAHLSFSKKWDEGYKKLGINYKGTKEYQESLDYFYLKTDFINNLVYAAMEKIKTGDLSSLPFLFAYLETNIKYYRSGYIKGEICRVIKKLNLNFEEKENLSRIILLNIGFAGREISEIAKLIPKINNDDFKTALFAFAEQSEDWIKKRIMWIARVYMNIKD